MLLRAQGVGGAKHRHLQMSTKPAKTLLKRGHLIYLGALPGVESVVDLANCRSPAQTIFLFFAEMAQI